MNITELATYVSNDIKLNTYPDSFPECRSQIDGEIKGVDFKGKYIDFLETTSQGTQMLKFSAEVIESIECIPRP